MAALVVAAGRAAVKAATVLVPALLLASLVASAAAWLAIRLLQRSVDKVDAQPGAESSSTASPRGFVVPARVYHARFLPKPSAHAFRYPALYLALELGALERHQSCGDGTQSSRRQLDVRPWLKYKDPASTASQPWTVSCIHPAEYMRPEYPSIKDSALRASIEASIRLKVMFELRHRNLIKRGPQDVTGIDNDDEARQRALQLDDEIGQIWSITMPSILGFQGINPLTTYFCYRPAEHGGRGALAFVLLEVHNTFTERHIYVLQCGVNEDAAQGDEPLKSKTAQVRRQGCDHQWTFPRTFHVSPFNDRGGFYTCSVKDLVSAVADRPVLDIRVTLLIPDPDSESKVGKGGELVKKMVAVLTSHPRTSTDAQGSVKLTAQRPLPLTASSLALALLRQPLDLFLTFPRIAYEAARLHWGKNRLDVFGKPEMDDDAGLFSASDDGPVSTYDGVGWPPSLNPTEPNRPRAPRSEDDSGAEHNISYSKQRSGALLRSAASASDRFGQSMLQALLQDTGHADLLTVVLPDEGGDHRVKEGQVTLYARSPAAYSDLLLYPPALAHTVGSRIARRWGVSPSTAAFLQLLAQLSKAASSSASSSSAGPVRLPIRLARAVRAAHVRWALGVSPASRSSRTASSDSTIDDAVQQLRQTIEEQFLTTAGAAHPFEAVASAATRGSAAQWKMLVHLVSMHLLCRAEEAAFRLLGARYVAGLEPWSEVRRAVELLVREQGQHQDEVGPNPPAWYHMGSARREADLSPSSTFEAVSSRPMASARC